MSSNGQGSVNTPLLGGGSIKSNQVAPLPGVAAPAALPSTTYLPPAAPTTAHPPPLLIPTSTSLQHPLQSPAAKTPDAGGASRTVKFAATTSDGGNGHAAAHSTHLGHGPTTPGGTQKFAPQHSEVQHGAGERVEEFIPFRFADLREQLYEDHKTKHFREPGTKDKFDSFCKWLSLRNTTRIALAFTDVPEKYSFVDPDNDTEDPGANRYDVTDRKLLAAEFEYQFLDVLDMGAFEELSQDEIDKSVKEQGAMGLSVVPCDPNIVDFKFWYRGERKKMIDLPRSWRTFFRKSQLETVVYSRLALRFAMRPEQEVHEYLKEQEHKKWGRCLCLLDCCKCLRSSRVVQMQTGDLNQNYVYLKLFKDVDRSDLDMLLPGAKARFTWFDWLMIWGPVLFGVGAAIYKAATSSLKFKSLIDIVLSLVLIVMPLTWGIKAYMAVKDKMAEHQAHLNSVFLLHNLDNNAGVVTGVLGEAQEQEDNEAMLAYFFLWGGLKAPVPTSKYELDAAVEGYLSKLIKDQHLGVTLDFEVADSIRDLEAMGLLKQWQTPEGTTMLQVPPLDEAVQIVHIRNFDENKEGKQHKGTGKLASAARMGAGSDIPWRECVGVYPGTGQKFRYFWNDQTGESTYKVPGMYIRYAGSFLVPGTSTPEPPGTASGAAAGVAPAGAAGGAARAAELPQAVGPDGSIDASANSTLLPRPSALQPTPSSWVPGLTPPPGLNVRNGLGSGASAPGSAVGPAPSGVAGGASTPAAAAAPTPAPAMPAPAQLPPLSQTPSTGGALPPIGGNTASVVASATSNARLPPLAGAPQVQSMSKR